MHRDTVCLRNISINTLHKGDDGDDDDDDGGDDDGGGGSDDDDDDDGGGGDDDDDDGGGGGDDDGGCGGSDDDDDDGGGVEDDDDNDNNCGSRLVELHSARNATIGGLTSALNKAKMGLQDLCKNMTPASPNTFYKKKLIQ